MFLNPFPDAFGLDIGDLSIKVVQLRNVSKRHLQRSFDPIVYRSTSLPHGLIQNGVIEEPEKVRKYILHLLRDVHDAERPIKSQWVVAAIPDTQAFLKRIDIEKKPNDVIEEDVLYAAKKHIPFGEDDYYIDWQITPGDGTDGTTSALIGAVPKRIADMYTYLLESMDLGVIALEVEAIAVARAMITAEKTYAGEARGILNLGATRTSFTVFDHDQIQFSVSLPFSGEAITNDIARECHWSYETAEKQKIAIGLEYKKEHQNCWSSITDMTKKLIDEIQKAIKFYTTHFPNANPITHVTMCGGGASMKRLDRILSLHLKITVQPGKVWKNLAATKMPPIAADEALRYAPAVGLALRASANPFFLSEAI